MLVSRMDGDEETGDVNNDHSALQHNHTRCIGEEEKQTEHPHPRHVYCGFGMRKTMDMIKDKTPRSLRDS